MQQITIFFFFLCKIFLTVFLTTSCKNSQEFVRRWPMISPQYCTIIRKLLSISYINIMKNFENIDCPYDAWLALHQIYINILNMLNVLNIINIFLMKRKQNVIQAIYIFEIPQYCM